MNEYPNENLDAELGPIAADLDRLAARERAAASPAMESRILMATRSALVPAAAARILGAAPGLSPDRFRGESSGI